MASAPRPTRPALVVAAPHSGSGKTIITLALMAALKARGLSVQPFKVGPDFIDPGLHSRVTGRTSRNLDGWMLGRATNRALFERWAGGADAAVVEGVMGLFDGYDGLSEAGSTAEMAKWLNLPVLLVVDACSMARSAAALVLGFTRFDPDLTCAGVVFNRVGSPGHLQYLNQAMQQSLPDLPVLGGIPRDPRLQLAERHLGLVTAEETRLTPEHLRDLAEIIERHLDLDRLLGLSRRPIDLALPSTAAAVPAPLLPAADRAATTARPPVVIAVARDEAFCFYYQDNLDLLTEQGAELIPFSPLRGDRLPPDASALYLGGGYPEVHAERLAANQTWLREVRDGAARGLPIYAECGGLMTLSRFIETAPGRRWPMAAVLPFGTRMLKRRKALGYTEVELLVPTPIGPPGLKLRGHEFHYSEIVAGDRQAEPSADTKADPAADPSSAAERGSGPAAARPADPVTGLIHAYRIQARSGRTTPVEGYLSGSVLASYVHLHWGSAPEAAAHFVAGARAWRERNRRR